MEPTNYKKEKRKNLDFNPMMFGKVPPQSVELEKAILGAMLLEKDCLFTAIEKLFSEIFYTEGHQRIFKAIQNLYDKNQPVDILTVVEQLKKNEDLEIAGGMYYISKVTQDVVSGANIEKHIMVIAECYLKREAIRLSGELISDAYLDESDAFEIVDKADGGFQKMQEKILTGNIKDIRHFGLKVLEEHSNVKQTGILGISTGIKAIDSVICGLVEPDLIIVAARPGMGKTALALSITHETSIVNNIPCAWFSLEMDGTQLVRRLASIDSGVDHEKIRKGETSDNEYVMLCDSMEKIINCPIYIEDAAGITIRGIRTRSNILKKKFGIRYIVVDYLQLMQGMEKSGRNRENDISEISRGLKMLAKELQMPVVALSQLSRQVEQRSDKMPNLSDLRESGAIEQDADIVVFLMRPEAYDMTTTHFIGGKEYSYIGLAIGKIAKNRHGSLKNIALQFTGRKMQFSDIEDNSF